MGFRARLPREFFRELQLDLARRLSDEGLDALLTDDPEDVAYLTGFFHHPCERPVAVYLDADGRATLLLPLLEVEHAQSQGTVAELVSYPEFPGTRPPFEFLADLVSPGALGHPRGTSVGRLQQMSDALPRAALAPTDLVVEARQFKRPEEVALHREAGRITDLMLEAGVQLIHRTLFETGRAPSEAEIAGHISSVGSRLMYEEHDDVVVVSPLAGGLVYAGANSARPHGLPSAYRPRPGDTIVLSLGCAVGGRFVEGERTFFLGEPDAAQRRYYEAVYDAQLLGRETLRAGIECCQANRDCLAVLRDAGLSDFIRHRQGHGIGLGMHEPPWLEDGDPTVLRPGMVVSNEPGIYVTGHAGYRVSDSLLITEDGALPFTNYPREIERVVIDVPAA